MSIHSVLFPAKNLSNITTFLPKKPGGLSVTPGCKTINSFDASGNSHGAPRGPTASKAADCLTNACNLDYLTPFKDREDAWRRLSPLHVFEARPDSVHIDQWKETLTQKVGSCYQALARQREKLLRASQKVGENTVDTLGWMTLLAEDSQQERQKLTSIVDATKSLQTQVAEQRVRLDRSRQEAEQTRQQVDRLREQLRQLQLSHQGVMTECRARMAEIKHRISQTNTAISQTNMQMHQRLYMQQQQHYFQQQMMAIAAQQAAAAAAAAQMPMMIVTGPGGPSAAQQQATYGYMTPGQAGGGFLPVGQPGLTRSTTGYPTGREAEMGYPTPATPPPTMHHAASLPPMYPGTPHQPSHGYYPQSTYPSASPTPTGYGTPVGGYPPQAQQFQLETSFNFCSFEAHLLILLNVNKSEILRKPDFARILCIFSPAYVPIPRANTFIITSSLKRMRSQCADGSTRNSAQMSDTAVLFSEWHLGHRLGGTNGEVYKVSCPRIPGSFFAMKKSLRPFAAVDFRLESQRKLIGTRTIVQAYHLYDDALAAAMILEM
ncbi:hypothetical protein PAPYR_6889 [Paratrimastix pyriformis]|uniref:Uncharacterized protein n=1 Tax=Paratrimastix pyriformis TaxID=342808 RepID=A0ABQ8UEF5_9EUKA|nr:hypothetical protein PAPYR_6889 [Paratrimastix pyriformis]